MGLLDSLKGDKIKDYDDYAPRIEGRHTAARGKDKILFVIKDHKKLNGVFLVVWQPAKGSFKYLRYDGENSKVSGHAGIAYADSEEFRVTRFKDGGIINIIWQVPEHADTDMHNVEMTTVIDGKLVSTFDRITILNQQGDASKYEQFVPSDQEIKDAIAKEGGGKEALKTLLKNKNEKQKEWEKLQKEKEVVDTTPSL